MGVKVTLCRFIESESYRHRLQRTVELPIPPFVGMVVDGLSMRPVKELAITKVVYYAPTDTLFCMLEPTEIAEFDWPVVSSNYGEDWQKDGCPNYGSKLTLQEK